MIYELNLPHPSKSLYSDVEKTISKLVLSDSAKNWLDNFHDNKVNSAHHLFTVSPNLDAQVQYEFGKFFTYPIIAAVGIMVNKTNSITSLPPHIDRARALGINYYINLGGDDVKTCFYDIEAPSARVEAINLKYTQVHKKHECQFEQSKWYAYNVCAAHSVENIVSLRSFLIIEIMGPYGRDNYRIENLVNDNYSHTNPIQMRSLI